MIKELRFSESSLNINFDNSVFNKEAASVFTSSLVSVLNQDFVKSECTDRYEFSFMNRHIEVHCWDLDLLSCTEESLVSLTQKGFHKALAFQVNFFVDGKHDHSASKYDGSYRVFAYTDDVLRYDLDLAIEHSGSLLRFPVEQFFYENGVGEILFEKMKSYLNSPVYNKGFGYQVHLLYKDRTIIVTYSMNHLSAKILHDYTTTDLAYGSSFEEYKTSKDFGSLEDVRNFSIESLLDEMYDHRDGEMIRSYSLGS